MNETMTFTHVQSGLETTVVCSKVSSVSDGGGYTLIVMDSGERIQVVGPRAWVEEMVFGHKRKPLWEKLSRIECLKLDHLWHLIYCLATRSEIDDEMAKYHEDCEKVRAEIARIEDPEAYKCKT